MRVWIIGKDGLLRRAFVNYLHDRCNLLLPPLEEVAPYDKESVKRFVEEHQPDVWINCLGQSHPLVEVDPETIATEAAVVDTLVYNAQRLADQAIRPLIIHFSSHHVFDGLQQAPYVESDLPGPLNAYGQMQWEAEQQIATYTHHLIFRTSWVFGIEQGDFVHNLLSKMEREEVVQLIDDQFARPTYAYDAAMIAWAMLHHRGLFHLCNEEAVSLHGLAQELAHLARTFNHPLKVRLIEPIPARDQTTTHGSLYYGVLDTQKLERTGIQLRSWSTALADSLQQFLKI